MNHTGENGRKMTLARKERVCYTIRNEVVEKCGEQPKKRRLSW